MSFLELLSVGKLVLPVPQKEKEKEGPAKELQTGNRQTKKMARK